MTYTTQQLQAMSDFEVNKALAEKLLAQYEHSESQEKKDLYCGFNGSMGSTYRYRDYCNNPNDIMPLAFERKLRLSPYMDIWCADFIATEQKYFDKSPLRAIACLLLIMEG